jgi:hypothetical protein
MTSRSDILEKLIRINIKKEKLIKLRRKLYDDHRMKLNRIQSLEKQLKLKQDIAFRELDYSMRQDEKGYKRVSLEDIFPEDGPLDLTGYDFLE